MDVNSDKLACAWADIGLDLTSEMDGEPSDADFVAWLGFVSAKAERAAFGADGSEPRRPALVAVARAAMRAVAAIDGKVGEAW